MPDSYHTPHPALTAFFGGLLTKVGIYTLFRIYPLIFPAILQEWQGLLLVVAGLTMLTGVFGALAVNTGLEITALASAVSLAPGSLCIDLSTDEKGQHVLYVHDFHVGEPDKLRASIKNGFERMVLHISRRATS